MEVVLEAIFKDSETAAQAKEGRIGFAWTDYFDFMLICSRMNVL